MITTRTLGAAIIGNALEWYDFTIYGYMAVTIAKLFFPTTSAWAPLLSTFGVFGVAYAVRPLGGIVLGYCADLYGRKAVLVAVIAVMMAGTAIIVVTPPYATIGIAAPLLIVSARLLQGLSAGGEFGPAVSFLIEHAPPSRRGYFGAWQFAGQGAAMFLSGLIGGALAQALSPEQLTDWGWRIPFILGLLIGPAGVLIRASLPETPDFIRQREKTTGETAAWASSLGHVVADHKAALLLGFAIVIGGTAVFYVLLVFMPTYAVAVLHLPESTAFLAPIVSGLVMMVFCPVMGWCSDLLGRKRTMAWTAAAGIILLFPAFAWLTAAPSVARVAVIAVFFGLLFSGYAGPFSAAVAALFPSGARSTGLSIAYNLGVSLVGGFSPFIVATLIAATGSALAPCYYVMACLTIGFAAIILMPREQQS